MLQGTKQSKTQRPHSCVSPFDYTPSDATSFVATTHFYTVWQFYEYCIYKSQCSGQASLAVIANIMEGINFALLISLLFTADKTKAASSTIIPTDASNTTPSIFDDQLHQCRWFRKVDRLFDHGEFSLMKSCFSCLSRGEHLFLSNNH